MLFAKGGEKKRKKVWHQWLMHLILPTQEAENRRNGVQRQLGQIVQKTLS
jgi:hypothetical protein